MLCTTQGGYGIGDNCLEKNFQHYSIKACFHPFSNKYYLSGTLMLRYKFREAADLQGGGGHLPSLGDLPPPLNATLRWA